MKYLGECHTCNSKSCCDQQNCSQPDSVEIPEESSSGLTRKILLDPLYNPSEKEPKNSPPPLELSMPYFGVCEIKDARSPWSRTRVTIAAARFALSNLEKNALSFADEKFYNAERYKYIAAISYLKAQGVTE